MLIIKPSTYFTLVAFLSHTTTAFYPYQPPPLLTLPLHRIDSRQNTHGIVTSQTPTQANSVAVDQDGQDLSYMVAVSFGDSKDTYHLLLDSAASSTWVMGRECTSEACRTHLLFGKGDSGSLTVCKMPSMTAFVVFTRGWSNGTVSHQYEERRKALACTDC